MESLERRVEKLEQFPDDYERIDGEEVS